MKKAGCQSELQPDISGKPTLRTIAICEPVVFIMQFARSRLLR